MAESTGSVSVLVTDASNRPVRSGLAVFTPNVDANAGEAMIGRAPLTVVLSEEAVVVELVAAGSNPDGFTYRVDFLGLYGVDGPFVRDSFDVSVPVGEVTPLSRLAPVPASDGTSIVVGPAPDLTATAAPLDPWDAPTVTVDGPRETPTIHFGIPAGAPGAPAFALDPSDPDLLIVGYPTWQPDPSDPLVLLMPIGDPA